MLVNPFLDGVPSTPQASSIGPRSVLSTLALRLLGIDQNHMALPLFHDRVGFFTPAVRSGRLDDGAKPAQFVDPQLVEVMHFQ